MTVYVALKNGRPSATGQTEDEVRRYAEEKAGGPRQTEWGTTGKLFAGNRWTGWEVHPIKQLEG